jgi:hypothetical protein
VIHVALTAARGAPRALKFDEIIFDKKIIFVLKIRKNTVFLAQGALSLYYSRMDILREGPSPRGASSVPPFSISFFLRNGSN